MKYEREATTKDGRRTWKITYELVRGPERKPKHRGPKKASSRTPMKAGKSQANPSLPPDHKPKKLTPSKPQSKKRNRKDDGSQLGMF